MKDIKAVIFDLDGVITDTQKFHSQIEAKLLEEWGIHFTPEEITEKYAGTSDREQFEMLFKKYGKPIKEVKRVLDEKYKILIKLLKGNIHSIPGSIKLIKNLKNNLFKLAVASSARRNFIEFVLSELKIRDYFEVIISAEEVKFSKPNPEIYLKTAKLLNESPNKCLVIEDAPSGIKAAKSAGMKCLAITTTHKKESLKCADKIINSFNESTKEII